MGGLGIIASLILGIFALALAGLVIAFVLVPLFKGLGWLIANFFTAIGWIIGHLFEFVAGMIGDTLRLVGAVLTAIVLLPFAPLNVVLGRWSAAGHFAQSVKRECRVAGSCLYRVLLRRPLKLLWLHGILEGVEYRLPEAMAATPGPDKPGRRTGQFDGYKIVGSLAGGGSGAKLYIAEPEAAKKAKLNLPDRVVIKSFALTEGSSLPQIVRESRALECAKQLGLVLEHSMDSHRFFYIMPYHAGDHLGIVTRDLHGQTEGNGLGEASLRTSMGYVSNLLSTLSVYHSGGLWHKDVKPDNVIIHGGVANLVDLGLITPLRSAMTLTTHGTEYFRDPEMVRQALRGVKVHQVDGAKFDVYAVGAVLYFMLENTFPAHGGLSKFSKSSPESLRWIVRRAMADYNKRYESSEAMLCDLQAVAISADPYMMRPVDLPSMRGEAAPAPEPAAPADPVASAATGVAAVVDQVVDAVAAAVESVDAPHSQDAPADRVEPASPRRPRLRVTNWWTGAYSVDGTEPVKPASPSIPIVIGVAKVDLSGRAFREHARSFREEVRTRRDQVRCGSVSARKAAREQVKSARDRARDLQRRARTRHHRVASKAYAPKPGGVLAAICVLTLLGGIFGVFMLAGQDRPMNFGPGATVTVESNDFSDTVSLAATGPSYMLVVDGDNTRSPRTRTQVKAVMDDYRDEGKVIVLPNTGHENKHVAQLLNAWNRDKNGPADFELEEMLQEANVTGILWTRFDGGELVGSTLIESERPGASHRRIGAPQSDLLLLLVNDHPTSHDPAVQKQVDEVIRRYGWRVTTNATDESTVRPVLPMSHGADVPARLHGVLAKLGYAGVVQIAAGPGDGPSSARVYIRKIKAEVDADENAQAAETMPVVNQS